MDPVRELKNTLEQEDDGIPIIKAEKDDCNNWKLDGLASLFLIAYQPL